LLAKQVDPLLHRHHHTPIVKEDRDPYRLLRIVAAGSLFEGDKGDEWINEFHIINAQLNEKGELLKYDLEF
jgi:hypothetical protein